MVPFESVPLLVDVGSALADAGGIVQYLLVFLFAAFPWVEILAVIPITIGLGLSPVLVGTVAFAGNVGSVYVLLVFHRRIARWRARRRSDDDAPADGAPDDASADAPDESPAGESRGSEKRRYRWAHDVWDRYGLPGLTLAAPVLTGVHIAALIALAAGSTRRAVAVWMTVSIALWSVALVAGSAYGVSLLGLG
ncbi:hypothetical protein JCM17823_28500 [Halorubrum gandharaense]